MGGTIGTDQTGPVDGKADGQFLDRHIMHDLVIAALQEGRIDRREGLHAIGSEAGGEGDGVLFGNADIKHAVREAFPEQVQPGTARHGRGDADNAAVGLGFTDQLLGEDLGVGRCGGLGLLLLAGDDVEFGDAMILVVGRLGGCIALALLGHDMDQDRAVIAIAHIAQDRDQLVEIMAVDRADIAKAHLLEQRAAHGHSAHVFLGPACRFFDPKRLGDALAELADGAVALRGDQAGEIMAHRADRRGDGHVIVVEDDNQPATDMTGIIHRFIGHAGRHRAIADDRDHIAVLVLEVAPHGKAERGRNGGRGMGRTERVVFAFRALGKAGQAAGLAQGADTVAATGQDLVRIALVSDIPDQRVGGGVEDVVERRGQLDHAETGTQMPAGDRDSVNGFGPHFIGQRLEPVERQVFQVCRRIDGV